MPRYQKRSTKSTRLRLPRFEPTFLPANKSASTPRLLSSSSSNSSSSSISFSARIAAFDRHFPNCEALLACNGQRPSTRTSSSTRTIMGTIARKESCPLEGGFRRYRSDRPVGLASPRCERASPYRSEPDPSRRSASQPKHRDRPRTRWPSHARRQKTWPFDVRDAYRFPRPYLEVRKGSRGRVAQTTR